MEKREQNEPSPEQLEQEIEALYIESGELRESYYEQMDQDFQNTWDDVEIEASTGLDKAQAKARLEELIDNVKRIIASRGTTSNFANH